MRSITYASTAVQPFTDQELQAMLERWVVANGARGVTGMLLYGSGHLMQTIEGPDEAVTSLFDLIVDDPRHHEVFVVLNEPITEREFPDWSMGFRRVSGESGEPAPDEAEEAEEPSVHVGAASPSRRMLDLFRSQWL